MSRRPTKASASSRSNAATFSTGYERPPTSSHLDLSSANDDDTTSTSGGSKIHKKSKQQLRLTHSNYKELAVLHNKYSKRGFTVLAFPSNDFHQEKDTNEEILSYVNENFPEVTFPLFSRAPLKTNMVFQLCEKQTMEKVEWNFHKYLVDGKGRAVQSYGHRIQPIDIEEEIVRLLDSRGIGETIKVRKGSEGRPGD
eukprot:scaffold5119_cov153-Skeletonema_dohrnii-CCMP3373.AAC.12